MTESEIRLLVADALDYASVPHFRGSETRSQFVAGTREVTFDEIEIDSLAAMEVCIALEANTGIVMLPGEVLALGSLAAVVRRVEAILAG